MNSFKKGFTLIELLVVIAIIAILAAILFPVFAQAKMAAKTTAALSNTKQIVLANLMYQNDYDDNFPLGTTWNTGNDALTFGPGNPSFSTWGWNLAPYIKTAQIFQDPTATANPSKYSNIRFTTFFTQFGYNYSFLSPVVPMTGASAGYGQITSTNGSQGESLSNTVFTTSKWTVNDNTSGSLWFVGGFPNDNNNSDGGGFGMGMDAGSEAPACWYLLNYCGSDWGAGSFFDPATPSSTSMPLSSTLEGKLTAGNAYRNGNNVTVSFCDGHAKSLAPSALAAGTNFSLTAASGQPGSGSGGQINVTHAGNYLWSLKKDCSDFASNCTQ